MDWQPIETAPKDGTAFLAACPFDGGDWDILRMHWVEYAGLFGDATYAPFIEDQTQPTHWQPLPEPPIDLPSAKEIVREALANLGSDVVPNPRFRR